MGGFGSGYKGIRKLTTGECLSININKLHIKRDNYYRCNLSWNDKNNSSISIIKQNVDSIRLLYTDNSGTQPQKCDYTIKLDYTKCNYGNDRPWFICPKCEKRVGILYAKKGIFLCRKCQDLNYNSDRVSGNKMNELELKIYKTQDKLKMKHGIDNYAAKRLKGMHATTFEKLCNEMVDLMMLREDEFIRIGSRFMKRFMK